MVHSGPRRNEQKSVRLPLRLVKCPRRAWRLPSHFRCFSVSVCEFDMAAPSGAPDVTKRVVNNEFEGENDDELPLDCDFTFEVSKFSKVASPKVESPVFAFGSRQQFKWCGLLQCFHCSLPCSLIVFLSIFSGDCWCFLVEITSKTCLFLWMSRTPTTSLVAGSVTLTFC